MLKTTVRAGPYWRSRPCFYHLSLQVQTMSCSRLPHQGLDTAASGRDYIHSCRKRAEYRAAAVGISAVDFYPCHIVDFYFSRSRDFYHRTVYSHFRTVAALYRAEARCLWFEKEIREPGSIGCKTVYGRMRGSLILRISEFIRSLRERRSQSLHSVRQHSLVFAPVESPYMAFRGVCYQRVEFCTCISVTGDRRGACEFGFFSI